MASWRKSTQKSYSVYLKRWLNYTKARKINPVSPMASSHIIAFLTQLFKQGIGYSAINTARSSIIQFVSICSGKDFGSNKLINKFMKGIFELKPALPEYTQIWDVQTVLHFLTTLPSELSLIMLSGKLTVLYLLLTAQCCQTLHLIQLADIKFKENSMIIALNHLLKQSKPGKHLSPLLLKSYEKDRRSCVVTVFQEYIKRTEHLRADEKLLISTQSPHKSVSKATVSRWIRSFLKCAGVLEHYAPHSIRTAAASSAKCRGIPIGDLLRTAGWSNASTFAKYYDKNIESHCSNSIQDCLLG